MPVAKEPVICPAAALAHLETAHLLDHGPVETLALQSEAMCYPVSVTEQRLVVDTQTVDNGQEALPDQTLDNGLEAFLPSNGLDPQDRLDHPERTDKMAMKEPRAMMAFMGPTPRIYYKRKTFAVNYPLPDPQEMQDQRYSNYLTKKSISHL